MDFTPHLRLRSGDGYISKDQSPCAESCAPERDSFSVLLMPQSLLIFKDDAYSGKLLISLIELHRVKEE